MSDSRRPRMTIGDFSRATGLSAKALRFYHGEGLLIPEEVDATNGYRFYSIDQLFEARVIRKLRELEVPVPDIREMLTTTDPASRALPLAQHAERLEQQARKATENAQTLRRLLGGGPADITISYERRSPLRVIGVRETIDLANLGAWFGESIRRVRAFAQRADSGHVGTLGGEWSTALLAYERGPAMIFAPIADTVAATEAGGLEAMRLPAVDLAVATSRGSDENVRDVYAALGAHVAQHELSVDEPIRESYLSGVPGRDADAVVEIGWPIFRIAR